MTIRNQSKLLDARFQMNRIRFQVGFLAGTILLGAFPLPAADRADWPEIKKLDDGRYEFDGIIIDKTGRKIEFPMIANQSEGLIEYALVHENGKIHESLFRTSIRPQIIHASLLLLKARIEDDFFEAIHDRNRTVSDYRAKRLTVEVIWDRNGSRKVSRMRDFYFNQKDRENRPDTSPFLLTGSRMIESTFMAEHSGSILAVYLDPDALVNSIESNSDNDDLWLADKSSMPPLESSVTCVLRLPAEMP